MKHYVDYFPSGQLAQFYSLPDSVDPVPMSGTSVLEIPDIESAKNHYFDGTALAPIPDRPSTDHDFDYTLKQWRDKRTRAQIKAVRWDKIKRARTAAEEAGFTWDGSTFDSDEVSQRRIGDAVTMAGITPDFTIDWTLADNTVRTLSATDMVNVGLALSQHVQAVFQRGRTRRAEIEAATTKQEVNAIIW